MRFFELVKTVTRALIDREEVKDRLIHLVSKEVCRYVYLHSLVGTSLLARIILHVPPYILRFVRLIPNTAYKNQTPLHIQALTHHPSNTFLVNSHN